MYNFDILETLKDGIIQKIGEKNFYNLDNLDSLSEWTPKSLNGFSYLISHNNNVMKSIRDVYFSNSPVNNGTKTYPIGKDNFSFIICNFCARKLVIPTWINDKDEFCAPTQSINQFYFDGIIFSLFNNSSNQKSNNESRNQFFWMSKEEMTNLANNNNYNELYNDARTDSDRYVYNLLFGEQRIYDQLSDEAKDVLDTASNLVRLSFGMRRNFADDTNHLNSWDAGYAQLKLLWKEYYPEQFKEFRDKYKVLEEKMRPMVYELGFLLK
jgi:hypothetical protein